MRVFLAGASGAIGSRLIPLLVSAGHSVTGLTRTPEKAEAIRQAGGEVVVADGLLFNALRSLLPSSIVPLPLGQALLMSPGVQKGLRPTDFYMIETRAYNAHRREFVSVYDSVRRSTGCFMNLDLQRVATPTGAASLQHREGLSSFVSVEAQVAWLLEGRNAERVVVEHLDDRAAFARYTRLPVVHLAEVAAP